MKLKTVSSFTEGRLIKIEYIDIESGEKMPDNYIPSKEDIIDARPPQWSGFIREIFTDEAYNQIANAPETSYRAIARLESSATVFLSNPTGPTDLIIQFFNILINTLTNTPTAEAIDNWNKIAAKYSMDIIFNNKGMIEKI